MTRRAHGSAAHADAIRRRLRRDPHLDLAPEELEVLADHGIDPEEVRRIALQAPDIADRSVSDHDRDTARDAVEALLLEHEDGDTTT